LTNVVRSKEKSARKVGKSLTVVRILADSMGINPGGE
jgi:hypothetical protein